MKSPEQRGSFGAWLVEQRQRLSFERGRKIKQQDVIDEIAASGYPLDAAYYRALEGGSKKPGRDTREALARFFGRQPPIDQPGGGPDVGELAAAIREQTAAINQLVAHLQDQPPAIDPRELAEQLGAALALHLQPLLDAAREHPVEK